jgi:uncharacterized membrane protein YgdD (TMEM256/DUF423 family)
MPQSAKIFLLLGSLAMMIAVGLGAFGAHGLKDKLSADMLAVYRTGVDYHFYHALGLLALGMIAAHLPESDLVKWSGALMAAGIVLFSGSLYLLALTGTRWLGAITPVGGAAWIVAWALLAAALLRTD